MSDTEVTRHVASGTKATRPEQQERCYFNVYSWLSVDQHGRSSARNEVPRDRD
jgi:hypothetical protein